LDEFVESKKQESSNLELGPIEVEIPDEWDSRELSTVFDLITGNNYTGDYLADEDNGGRIFLTLKSVNKGGGFNWDSLKYYTGEVNEREIVEPGELLIANTDVTQNGDIVGYSIRVPDFDSDKEIAASMDLSILRPTSDNINLPYIEYLLQTEYIHSRMRAFSAGSTVLHLNTDLVESLSLPLPPLSEQRKIATVLYTVDQAIQKTEEIIEQHRRLYSGLLQSEFHGENEDTIEAGTLGEIPETWDSVPLSDVAEVTMGNSPKSKYYNSNGEGLPFYQGADEFGERSPTPDRWCSNPKKIGKPGDTLLNIRSHTNVGKVNQATHECCIGRELAAITAGERVDEDYLYHHFREREKYVNAIASGSTFDSVNSKEVESLKFALPPLEKQRQIASVLNDVQMMIQKEKSTVAQFERVKESLMQDLLSGTVRTADTNIEVPDEIAQHG
jgi:type I restriction enzyme S subunit